MYLLSSKAHARQRLSPGTSGQAAVCLGCQPAVHSTAWSAGPAFIQGQPRPLQWQGRAQCHPGNLKLAVYSMMSQLPLRRKLSSELHLSLMFLMYCGAPDVTAWKRQIRFCPGNVKGGWPQFTVIIPLCRKLEKRSPAKGLSMENLWKKSLPQDKNKPGAATKPT